MKQTIANIRSHRAWVPILLFVLTLIPAGFGYTFNGQAAAMVLGLELAMTMVVFYPLVAMSDEFERNGMRRLVAGASRRFFGCSTRLLLAAVLALFLCQTLALGYYNYGWEPYMQDSNAMYIHAKMLAQGNITLPPYPLPKFFQLGLMVQDGRYYSQFPPGHVLLLALGHVFNAPFLINPLLGMLTCVVIYALARELYGEKTARLSLLLCVVSPWLLLTSAEFSNHATSLFFTSAFLLFFIRGLKYRKWHAFVLAGFCIAYVAIARPYTGVAVAFPSAIYALYLLRVDFGKRVMEFSLSAVGAVLPLTILLWFNHATTGDALVFGYEKLKVSPLGFVPIPADIQEMYGRASHTLMNGIGQAFNTLNALHYFVFCWPTSSLLFIPCAFLLRKTAAYERLLLATAMSLIVFYIYYYYQDWAMGPRFAYELLGILLIFTAQGILRAPEVLKTLCNLAPSVDSLRVRVAGVVAVSSVFGVLFGSHLSHSQTWWPDRNRLYIPLEKHVTKPALVFVEARNEYFPLTGHYYPVRDDSPVIVAADIGEKNKELMALYPHYHAYRVRNLGTDKEVWESLR